MGHAGHVAHEMEADVFAVADVGHCQAKTDVAGG